MAGRQAVAAVPTTYRANWHVEVEEVLDVPAYGALVDLEPCGQGRDGVRAAVLEQSEEGEDTSSRTSHSNSSPNTGRRLPSIAPSVDSMNTSSHLVSVRLIVSDIRRIVGFYEAVLGAAAEWGNDDFAELVTPRGTLAVGTTRTVPLFGAGSAEPSTNRTAIIEFMVDDVDAEWTRLRPRLVELGSTVVTQPTTMPWGNRAMLLRDPEGTLVNLFTPVTDEARSKFSART